MKKILLIVVVFITLVGCVEFKEFVRKLPRWDGVSKSQSSSEKQGKQIYTGEIMGLNEHVLIANSFLPPLKAKLDSEIRTTAMDVEIISTSDRNDKEFVLYRVRTEGGAMQEFEKEILRWDTVRKSGSGATRRPVVMIELCIGNERVNGEVSLANKEHFLYPILIGNNVLEDSIIVDPSKSFTTEPDCK